MQDKPEHASPWHPVDALADAPALLAQLIRQSPVGIAVVDQTGLLRSVNPAYCTIHGYPEPDLLGRSFTVMFPPAQRDQMLALHRAVLADGSAISREWDVLRQDGEPISVMAQSVRVCDAVGQPCRLVYVMDITQRKRTEQALQSSQQFLQSVLDGLTAQVCVLDDAGVIVAVNRAWREFAAAEGAAIDRTGVGCSYLAVCEQAMQGTADEDSAEAAQFARLLRVLLAGERESFQLEYACHSPARRRWFLASVSRITGSEPPRTVVSHDNVTAVKHAQATLRDSEALLLDLAASIPGALFRLVRRATGGWHFAYFSPGIESLFELTPQAACGDIRILGSHILPEDRPAHDQSIRDAVAQGMLWEHEYRIRTRSGRLKWVHAKASAKPGPAGDVIWTGVLTDVSDRRGMDAAIKASEEKYRTLFETVPQGVVYQDASGYVTSANPAAQRILGLTIAQMQSTASIDPRWQVVREDGGDLPPDQQPAMRALRTGEPVTNVVMGVSVPGRGHAWLLVNATPLFRQGEVHEVYTSFEDITERVLMSRELRLQANTDYLTGVANRRGLMERLQLELERMHQQPARRCALLAADLDLFKHVNDSWGHAAGDAVLQHVAGLMLQITRQKDLVARSGGEEFTLLLLEMDEGEALALAERLRQRLEATPLRWGGQTVTVTLSIGVSLMSLADGGTDAALVRADQALYQAKAAGRNLVRLAASPD